jgi:hypothetical protein
MKSLFYMMIVMSFFLISCGSSREGEVYGGVDEREYQNQWRYYDENNQYRGREHHNRDHHEHHEEHHHEHHEGHKGH